MSEIWDTDQSDGGSGGESQDGYHAEASGWENINPIKINKNIIKIANRKIKLIDVFKSLNISFEEYYSPSGWTHKCSCPLPNHRDSSPSFGFNPIENRFHCFGCSRSGGPVRFISYLEGISPIEAAQKLLNNFSSLDDAIFEVEDNYNADIDDALLGFSKKIRELLKFDPDIKTIEFVDKLTWGLDLYLHKHVPSSSINVENLKTRISLLENKLEQYIRSLLK